MVVIFLGITEIVYDKSGNDTHPMGRQSQIVADRIVFLTLRT